MKFIILFLLLTPMLTANKCQSSKKEKSTSNTTVVAQSVKMVIINKDFDYITASRDVKVTQATVKDSLLTLKVKYNGCQDDDIDLVFTGNYLKSYPPKIALYLSKKTGTVDCGKTVEKDLFFILTPTKYPNNKTLILQFLDYEPKPLYNY